MRLNEAHYFADKTIKALQDTKKMINNAGSYKNFERLCIIHFKNRKNIMIKLLVYLILLSIPMQIKASCITDKEYEIVLKILPNNNDEYYDNYPYGKIKNIADCNSKSALSDLVCDNPRLKKMLLLLSMGEIYAYENATHTPVEDYSTYNDDLKDWLNNLIKEEKDKNTALRKLCYVIRSKLSNDFGGDFNYSPTVHEIISSKANNNGVVVDTLTRTIYLGNSCDVVTSAKEKGYWYKEQEQLVIELKEQKYKFNLDDKSLNLNCKQPK